VPKIITSKGMTTPVLSLIPSSTMVSIASHLRLTFGLFNVSRYCGSTIIRLHPGAERSQISAPVLNKFIRVKYHILVSNSSTPLWALYY